MNWSIYQRAIFDFIAKSTQSLVIEAVAGSGKTSTLVEAVKHVPIDLRVAFIAFNSHIAEELKKRVTVYYVGTLHGLGYRFIRTAYKGTKVFNGKTFTMLAKMEELAGDNHKQERFFLAKLVSSIKSKMLDYNSQDVLIRECAKLDIQPKRLDLIPQIMEESIKSINKTIDFDDMIYIPAIGKVKVWNFDVIFADEAQDFNPAQLALILKLNGRLIACGDTFQSCYAFRGAENNVLQKITIAKKADNLPLSICYRCPSSHIELAKQIVPHIETLDNAKSGDISTLGFSDLTNNVQPEAMLLSRKNSILVKVALDFLKAGKKCVIRGEDLAKKLIDLIEGFNCEKVSDLLKKLESYDAERCRKLSYFKLASKLQEHKDIMSCINELASRNVDVEGMVDGINAIFDDEGKGIVASSIHRAKGLQADNVYVLDHNELGDIEGLSDIDAQQELNLKYIALTRSTNKLVLVQ